jgi:hypothetical protein
VSQVLSFAEESCWDGERFRTIRREIVFVVTGFQIRDAHGESIRREFRADFGLWYDVDDDWLIQILKREEPSIRWDWFVYHKKLDHSAIIIHDPNTGKALGQIYPRGRTKQKLSGENSGANITTIAKGKDYRAERLRREEERAARRGERHSPEGC